jgi:polyisoprenoid-binding protein YceI
MTLPRRPRRLDSVPPQYIWFRHQNSFEIRIKQRDKRLRSADFFDVANHPDITVAVEGVSAARDDTARITGTLTVRGRTRPLDFGVRVASADGAVRLDGEVEVNRADFGLTWNFLGMAALRATIVVHAVFTPA